MFDYVTSSNDSGNESKELKQPESLEQRVDALVKERYPVTIDQIDESKIALTTFLSGNKDFYPSQIEYVSKRGDWGSAEISVKCEEPVATAATNIHGFEFHVSCGSDGRKWCVTHDYIGGGFLKVANDEIGVVVQTNNYTTELGWLYNQEQIVSEVSNEVVKIASDLIYNLEQEKAQVRVIDGVVTILDRDIQIQIGLARLASLPAVVGALGLIGIRFLCNLIPVSIGVYHFFSLAAVTAAAPELFVGTVTGAVSLIVIMLMAEIVTGLGAQAYKEKSKFANSDYLSLLTFGFFRRDWVWLGKFFKKNVLNMFGKVRVHKD